MQSLSKAPIKQGTKVFVRCDIDVPIENGVIGETFRLDNLLETLKFIIEKGGTPIIAGHIGKPEGVFKQKLSTKQLLPYFNEKLGEGKFELLENLRFDPREEQNICGVPQDEKFAKELASKAELYVNESFATCHREHASIVGIPRFLPHYAGFRLQKELTSLDKILKNPDKPFIVIIGGAKLESKMPVIEKFATTADFVLLSSLLSANWSEAIRSKDLGLLPHETPLWSKEIPQNLVLSNNKDLQCKDTDPKTIEKFKEIIKTAKTILWAGPLGMYEKQEFIAGTKEIANEIALATEQNNAYSVIGGGDTIAAVNKLGLLNKFSFVSTGGGAMLQYLAEGTLLGIEALN